MAFEGPGPLVTSASVWDTEGGREGRESATEIMLVPKVRRAREAGGQGIHLCQAITDTFPSPAPPHSSMRLFLSEALALFILITVIFLHLV